MSIKKKYLKTKPVCKVTFRFHENPSNSVKSVNLVGEFNDWNKKADSMNSLKSGAFTLAMDLELDREYQFRYLVDGTRWENELEADKHVPTIFGDSNNSVIIV